MNMIDAFKAKIIIEEAKKKFEFLSLIKVQDDISSQLAGYQISKLLKTQSKHQETYAELVAQRSKLVGIAQKKQLGEIQNKIASVSAVLKESTKKLCKLFKENPDLQKDSYKVSKQRKNLIMRLDELIGNIESNQLTKFQGYISQQLGSQDQLRQFIDKQKRLTFDIKSLQQKKNLQNKQYQKEIREAQNKIQDLKEQLMHRSNNAEMQVSYDLKEKEAELSNIRRINEYKRKALQQEIESLNNNIVICTRVHQQLKQYLVRTQREIKEESQKWSQKSQKQKEDIQNQNKNLSDQIASFRKEHDHFRLKAEDQEQRKRERQRQERQKQLAQAKMEFDKKRRQNAIKLIQQQYDLWKQSGGGKKKKKGAPKKPK